MFIMIMKLSYTVFMSCVTAGKRPHIKCTGKPTANDEDIDTDKETSDEENSHDVTLATRAKTGNCLCLVMLV